MASDAEVGRLLAALEKELSASNFSTAAAALEELGRCDFTVPLLKRSRAGVRAAELRSHAHSELVFCFLVNQLLCCQCSAIRIGHADEELLYLALIARGHSCHWKGRLCLAGKPEAGHGEHPIHNNIARDAKRICHRPCPLLAARVQHL